VLRRTLRKLQRKLLPKLPAEAAEEDAVLISTANDLPGHEIDRVLGEVFGLTVRSRNLGSQLGASLKSLIVVRGL